MSEKPIVWFAPFKQNVSKMVALKKVINAIEFGKTIKKDALTAVKIHFGEKGNDVYIRPIFVRAVVDEIKKFGGKPFLVDSNTLYLGSRKNSVDHLMTAIENGFGYEVTGAPSIIADGLRGNDFREVEINGDYFKKVKISSAIYEADAMVVVSHFKGHVSAGYGGAIKNLGMGCAPSGSGKKEQHAVRLGVNQSKCIGCGRCTRSCPSGAATMVKTEKGVRSSIDINKCIGCCECMTVCPATAIEMVVLNTLKTGQAKDDKGSFCSRIAEYAYGAVKDKVRTIYINAMMDITPLCDCCGWADEPIVPNIGFAASTDPVALDKACYDMVCEIEGSCHGKEHFNAGDDKFLLLHPQSSPHAQFEHGEKIGMGSTNYELRRI